MASQVRSFVRSFVGVYMDGPNANARLLVNHDRNGLVEYNNSASTMV